MGKNRTLALDSWGAYHRNDFNEPRLLHLPIYRKVLNSFTWDIRFSLPVVSCSNYLIFVAKPLYIWLFSYLFRAVLYNYWEAVSQASSPQNILKMKQLSTFRLCSFSSQHMHHLFLGSCFVRQLGFPEWFVGRLHIICQQANNWPLPIDILVINLLSEYSHWDRII